MIDIKYSKAILNILFAKNASGGGLSAPAEKAKLIEEGVPENGVSSEDALAASERKTDSEDVKERKEKTRAQYDSWKGKVNGTTYWKTLDLPPKTETYTYYDSGKSVTLTASGTGWTIVRKYSTGSALSYPSKRYLALFTKMPGADGTGFEEPFLCDENGIPTTTYRRVNLDSGYFSKTKIMNAAAQDKTNGGAFTSNNVTIYYPEITDVNWGVLVGFGIFENEEPTEEEKPYLWGTLSNTEDVSASVDHVPLFRKGNFQLSIS